MMPQRLSFGSVGTKNAKIKSSIVQSRCIEAPIHFVCVLWAWRIETRKAAIIA